MRWKYVVLLLLSPLPIKQTQGKMPKKPKIIEPIPPSMEEIVQSFFAKWPEPRDPSKGKKPKKTKTKQKSK